MVDKGNIFEIPENYFPIISLQNIPYKSPRNILFIVC